MHAPGINSFKITKIHYHENFGYSDWAPQRSHLSPQSPIFNLIVSFELIHVLFLYNQLFWYWACYQGNPSLHGHRMHYWYLHFFEILDMNAMDSLILNQFKAINHRDEEHDIIFMAGSLNQQNRQLSVVSWKCRIQQGCPTAGPVTEAHPSIESLGLKKTVDLQMRYFQNLEIRSTMSVQICMPSHIQNILDEWTVFHRKCA